MCQRTPDVATVAFPLYQSGLSEVTFRRQRRCVVGDSFSAFVRQAISSLPEKNFEVSTSCLYSFQHRFSMPLLVQWTGEAVENDFPLREAVSLPGSINHQISWLSTNSFASSRDFRTGAFSTNSRFVSPYLVVKCWLVFFAPVGIWAIMQSQPVALPSFGNCSATTYSMFRFSAFQVSRWLRVPAFPAGVPWQACIRCLPQ